MINNWWADKDSEVYWLEVTGRDDLGANLKAPQTNEQGDEFWSYSLLKFTKPGDIVFHYYRPERAITAQSIITGEVWEDEIVWAARGTSARHAGITPHTRPGWHVGLENYKALEDRVTLIDIRETYKVLLSERNKLVSLVREPIYFPFELGSKRPMRPMQGYLFKLPAFFVKQFPQLRHQRPLRFNAPATANFGANYRPADEDTAVGQRDPFSVDPTLVERALTSHAKTQNALATFLRECGLEPRSPAVNEPNFDLAWLYGSETWVAEVKSLTEANEEKQLRLGLGQLLRYKQLLEHRGKVCAVLVTERPPSDNSWLSLCEQLNVVLVWPQSWRTRFPFPQKPSKGK